YEYEGGAKGYGTVFKVGASLPTPTNTPTATSTPGHITVIPNESACDVSKAKADDLVALSSLSDSNSPSVKCTVGPEPGLLLLRREDSDCTRRNARARTA